MLADLDNLLTIDKLCTKLEPRSRNSEQKLSCTMQMTAKVYKPVTEGEAPSESNGPARVDQYKPGHDLSPSL